MFKTILVATDSSEHADKAVAVAGDLAAKYDANISLVHILLRRDSEVANLRRLIDVQKLPDDLHKDFDRFEDIQKQGKASTSGVVISLPIPIPEALLVAVGDAIVDKAETIARKHGASKIDRFISEGDPADVIIGCAKSRSADLIVMGTRGLSPLTGMFVGSVSHKVSHLADCTCITVR
jgi:nucleotide-binding universal stress UspA family protein